MDKVNIAMFEANLGQNLEALRYADDFVVGRSAKPEAQEALE